MRNYIRPFLLVFVAFLICAATSCQRDSLGLSSAEEGYLEFNITTEDHIDTKAISDGTMVDVLYYAVYKNGEELTDLRPSSPVVRGEDGRFVFKIKLVKGLSYQVAFWAQSSSCTAYDLTDFEAMTISYDGIANDETRDAFFKTEDVMFTSNTQVTEVVLRRPFAQINFAAVDYKVVTPLLDERGFTSSIRLQGVPNVLNLLTGETSGSVDVEYDFSAAPSGENNYFDNQRLLRYVSMNYILAEKEKRVYTQEPLVGIFKYGNVVLEVPIHNLPVQRNYRTNILGYLFSADISFTIDLNEIFDNETNRKHPIQ